MKYRILAWLDKLTLHKTSLCGRVWDIEMHFGIDWGDVEENETGILITDGKRTIYWDSKTETATLSE